ncbi:glycerol kinase-like [Paramacrobiotus metropolitanus]|uniref:glycerol kinase-like n=1 Tax=Paramacrobiotus metropolitanus TaxID=2943436 RepID=UPI00244602C4|nr:glycerol kinase-like [Paramacrobiotus metropolitanus]XP_055331278.1 glycerol kinase-like [Paramacrobiotus metropolitanus]XP_055331279.1 glycerol kinase-like [Paramacrobiotus metropolitanus]XP_055331280.1 glycerol kinase-like [Paramacrobiotus metropolitanus]XP_055331281.1 glycerol kinase-like [Paramacrobiotus metropolitanus]XP_055331282.1 glycerol kinase-like [Paramacrobiotus metropolitanus]XP_055331283.1 glycerol kinase-like [Paramacrobiotus metropolitanus]
MGRPDEENLIATLDVGTSSIRCMIFDAKRQVLAKHQIEIRRIYPEPSWVEQDPHEIVDISMLCMNKAADDLVFAGYSVQNITGLGISNQRETTVVWDKKTGRALYNAIVWLDNRTADLAAGLIKDKAKGDQDYLKPLCGLPIHPYFSALKLRWIIDNVAPVREAIRNGTCLFGTVDSWVLWNLTGGQDDGVHKTDVTNASRTMLMNLKTMDWDSKLVDFFSIPVSVLPTICSSSEEYGIMKLTNLAGRPVCGILGDQQAALVGHGCFRPGMAKCTYGTGCFLLANVGYEPKLSHHGLLTTVAYQLGPKSPAVYALEGSVAMAGAVVNWLQKNLGVIQKAEDLDGIAGSVKDSGGIYFVPAFSGLLAPYWDTEARGIICGLTEYIEQAHFARAALESIAFQICEVVDAVKTDSGVKLMGLEVDGGLSQSALLMQIQANFSGLPVHVPKMSEITSVGAAVAVAHATGVKTFLESDGEQSDKSGLRYVAEMKDSERREKYSFWKEAVRRSMHWARDHSSKSELKAQSKETSAFVIATGSVLSTLAVVGVAIFLCKKYWH